MDTEAAAGMGVPGGSRSPEAGAVRLADRFEIGPGAQLADYASPSVPVVAAVELRGPARPLMALVVPRRFGLREEALIAARRIDRAHVLRPLDWGVADWPTPTGVVRQPLIISERPSGARVMAREAERIEPFGEDALVRRVLRPLTNALHDLHAAGIAHRGVRPDNLFWRDATATEAVLGEGWAAPPGLDQPAIYETVPHGMALPAGRGSGRAADDLYSLGATLAVLLAGRNPAAQLSEHAMIAAKIQQGSFAVLAGSLRLSTPMAEVLRGLLADNPDDRWTIEDLERWFDGRRLSPKAPNLPLQAARPLVFKDSEYWSRQSLAHGLAGAWADAVRYLPESGLAIWLKRSLTEEKRAAAANSLLSGSSDSGRHAQDLQLARILMLLDPAAPVRYRDISVEVDGFGTLLADNLERTSVVQQIAQAINNKLPVFWLEHQEDSRAENGLARKSVDALGFFLNRSGIGFGLERCLYEASPGLPCRSPRFESDYLTHIQDVLAALDRAAAREGPNADLFDRHLTAFIGARLGTSADGELTRLAGAESPPERCIALLRVLATIQAVTGVSELAHLGSWVAAQLKPLIESFHHRPFRDALAKEVGPLCQRGDFAGIVRLVENDDLRMRDTTGFRAAARRFAKLRQQAEWIRGGGLTNTARVQAVAHQAAAIVSGSVAALASGAVLVFFAG